MEKHYNLNGEYITISGIRKAYRVITGLENDSEMTDEQVYEYVCNALRERERLWVCERCLWGIESREGKQTYHMHYIDDDDVNSKCDWCETDGHFALYELI